jgi:hypothetical protein
MGQRNRQHLFSFGNSHDVSRPGNRRTIRDDLQMLLAVGLTQALGIPADDHKLPTRFRQIACQRLPEATGGACDQCDFLHADSCFKVLFELDPRGN